MAELAPHIFDLDNDALERLVQRWGMRRFRAQQLLKWVYERGVADPHRMTDISKADREAIAERLTFTSMRAAGHQLATDGTEKLLLELAETGSDAAPPSQTECVMIPTRNKGGAVRRTACVSSQVGCAVGCRFCASGLGGLERNLSAGRIVEQVWSLSWNLGAHAYPNDEHLESGPPTPGPRPITNVVFMGMGEPLTNFDHVTRAIRILTADWGMNLSARRITLSTVGLPAQMRRLAEIEIPITLALSLHAPNDELRRELIPWAEYTSIDALVEAGRHYFEKTGREITIEYILLGGVNDRPKHARQLLALSRRMRCNVNLIRYNEVAGLPFDRPKSDDVHRFQRILTDGGLTTHIRASRGRDIAAACGQLRHETQRQTSSA